MRTLRQSMKCPLSLASGYLALAMPWLPVMSSHAEDWPQWRGPNRDGVLNETGLMESFPPEGIAIRWRQPVGLGWSTPAVSGGRVFVTASEIIRPATSRERVHCFDETTGQPLWSFSYDVAYPEWVFLDPPKGQEAGPSATPIVEDGKVYTLGGNGHLHCLDVATGPVLWDRKLESDYQIEELKCRASPLIDGDRLIVFVGGKPGACVIALDKHTGSEVWRALDEDVSNSSPLIIESGGRRELIVWTDDSVTSLIPETGKTNWRLPLKTSNNDSIASPVFHNGHLLIGGLMLKLGDGESPPTVLWPDSMVSTRRILSNTSTAQFRSDHVFSAKSSGELVCLEAATGREVWRHDQITDLLGGASIHLTAIRDTDIAFLFNDRGELILARLTPAGYSEISRAKLLEPTYQFGTRKVAWTPPAYANGHVFARSDREVLCGSLKATP